MRFIFILFIFSGGACRDQTAGSRFEKIAVAYCECTVNLAEMSAQVALQASDTTAHVSFQQKLLDLQEEYNKAKECASTIKAQYGKLTSEDLVKVQLALTQKCAAAETQKDWLSELLGE